MNLLRCAVLGLGLPLFGSNVLPASASAAECFEGVKVADGCVGLPYEGCCDEGGGTQWCETADGPTCRSGCVDGSGSCGWSGAYYACGGAGTDPSGMFPIACASCDPPCSDDALCVAGACQPCTCGDQQCGPGMCGQSCGDCAPDATCVAGTCVGAPTCVDVALVACDGLVSGDTAAGTSAIGAWGAHGAYGPELAYRFLAADDDQISIVLESEAALVVAITQAECRADATLSAGPADPFWLTNWVPVTAGATYFVVVDSPASGPAPFTFTLRCQSTCTPKCGDRACGDDGCAGSCGECAGVCAKGVCYADDGCASDKLTGGVGCPGCACEACVCAADEYCCAGEWDSVCQGECLNVCQGCGALDQCGDGTCAGAETCANCAADCACLAGLVCDPTGTCCSPHCEGRECGSDACGGSCGDPALRSLGEGGCAADEACTDGQCVPNPTPDVVEAFDAEAFDAEAYDTKSLDAPALDDLFLPDTSAHDAPTADLPPADRANADATADTPRTDADADEIDAPAIAEAAPDASGEGGCSTGASRSASSLWLVLLLSIVLASTRRRGSRPGPSARREH